MPRRTKIREENEKIGNQKNRRDFETTQLLQSTARTQKDLDDAVCVKKRKTDISYPFTLPTLRTT
ncbi:MAG: hypothetical protein L6V93_09030 [Clostridiales bacterium]|nr:MAG: hypothetical protein L6V93_09030 [Clostridiales bacterium]